MATETTKQVEAVVAALNAAFAADPQAVHALLCNRVPCNRSLADDPFFVVEESRVLDEGFTIDALGLVNGVLGAAGLPLVCAKFAGQAGDKSLLLGFEIYEPGKPEPGR